MEMNEFSETLAMKGLILNCMGRHDEAKENVKRGTDQWPQVPRMLACVRTVDALGEEVRRGDQGLSQRSPLR